MLRHLAYIDLPRHSKGGFDHADVHQKTGRVFLAHTANGAVEVIDGEQSRHMATLDGCPEASGVICAQREDLIFAAARGTGDILQIDANTLNVTRRFVAGSKPNGLAWDGKRKHLLVADVQDNTARLVDADTGRITFTLGLRGRPRWCQYDPQGDQFLVNISDPPGVSVLNPETLTALSFLPISIEGPHGLELGTASRAFVACDGKALIVLDLRTGSELKAIPITGSPDVIWYNPRRERLYIAIGKPGVIDVIDTVSMTTAEKVQTEERAHTLAFDRLRQRLYVFLPDSCRAGVYLEG